MVRKLNSVSLDSMPSHNKICALVVIASSWTRDSLFRVSLHFTSRERDLVQPAPEVEGRFCPCLFLKPQASTPTTNFVRQHTFFQIYAVATMAPDEDPGRRFTGPPSRHESERRLIDPRHPASTSATSYSAPGPLHVMSGPSRDVDIGLSSRVSPILPQHAESR